MKAQLVGGIALLSLLGGAGWWLGDAGYRRGMADCQAEARRTRAEIEARWIRDADRIAIADKERDDAVATVDAADAGDDICLGPDSLQPLKAIR